MYFSKKNVVEIENVDRIIYGHHNNIFILLKNGRCLEYENIYVIQAKEDYKNEKTV